MSKTIDNLQDAERAVNEALKNLRKALFTIEWHKRYLDENYGYSAMELLNEVQKLLKKDVYTWKSLHKPRVKK